MPKCLTAIICINVCRHIRREYTSLNIKYVSNVLLGILCLTIKYLYGRLATHNVCVFIAICYFNLSIGCIVVSTIVVIDNTAISYLRTCVAHLAYEVGVASSGDISCSIIERSTTHHDTSSINGNNVRSAIIIFY